MGLTLTKIPHKATMTTYKYDLVSVCFLTGIRFWSFQGEAKAKKQITVAME